MSAKNKLKHSLLQLLKRDNQGAFATRHDRKRLCLLFMSDLHKLGYKIIDVKSLKLKHITAVIKYWQNQNLSNSTIKNRMSAIRHLSNLTNNKNLVPSNSELNISPRKYIRNINRAIFNPDFSKISNRYIKASLELQRVFGLRREESLKIRPHLADKSDKLELSSSWCKGGRSRSVPIRTDEQRYWLEQAKQIVGKYGNSLIPQETSYIRHRNVYDQQVCRTGLSNLHGLRHAYAQQRYKELTGFDPPIKTGVKTRDLTSQQKEIDHKARMIITEELGHSRKQITNNYLGI